MLDFLNKRLEELLGAFLLAVMACVAFANVIVRYCTNLSFAASEEITVNLFVWIVLLGTSRAFREGTNFSMNLLYDAMPRLPPCLYVRNGLGKFWHGIIISQEIINMHFSGRQI